MREASTKPSAATVLPAPVACSNQKRLAALGSSGCSSSWASSVVVGVRAPVLRLLGLVVVLVVVLLARDADGRERDDVLGDAPAPLPCPLPLRWASASSAVSVPDSASTWWAESTVPSTSCGSSSLSSRSRPSSSENVRRHSTEGTARPASSSASAASSATRRGRARRERGRGVLALVDEGLARELRGPFEVRGSRCVRGADRPLAWIQPRKGEDVRERDGPARCRLRRPVKPSRARRRAGCRCGCAPSNRAARE